MPLRPCLDCGTLTPRSRCPTHHTATPTAATRDWPERQRRAHAVATHRTTYGDTCPGWQRPPHTVTPPNVLTADHIVAIAAGGNPQGPLQVLCRTCNSTKAANTANT